MEKKKLPPGILSIQFLILMCYSSLTVITLLPLYLEHLGGSPREIGLFVSLFSFAAFFSRPAGGWLLSKVNPIKVLIAGLFLGLAGTVSYLFVEKLNWVLGLIRILHGAGFSIFILAALLIVVLKSRKEERAYAIGVVSTGFMLPLLIVPYLGEEVIQKFGYFFFFLLAIFLAIIPMVFALSTRITFPWHTDGEVGKDTGFLHLLRERRIMVILLLTLIFEMGLSSSLSFVPLLAHNESSMRAGFFYTFLGLTAVFLRLYGGKKFKFWGSSQLLLPAFFFLSCGSLLTSLSSNNFILSLSGIVWGLGTGVLYPHLSALIVEKVSLKARGKVLSLFAASVDLGFGFGPLIFGWISQFFGLRRAFVIFALFILLSSLPLILHLKSKTKVRSAG
ncbi:MAG: MFS transporter [Candidatus Aminicenantaceae bacterium]